MPLMTSPPPSLPDIDLESQQSLRGALQSEVAASSVSQGNFSPPSTDRTHREVSSLQRTLASEAEKQVQTLESDQRFYCQEQKPQWNPSEELTEGRSPSNQIRERHREIADEPPTQRPRLESPASVIRWSRTDESGHWAPVTAPEAEEMFV